ncbi:MAG: FAD-binding oxidoreductase [Bacteroidia bacterium]|nr:FAD-binding oxidoreductase [Bacteroidia bacterium]
MPKTQTILIAGGGLAGTFLAAALCRRGNSVVLADTHLPGAATPVAAGLFNIITGRLASKTWMADTLLSFLNEFFRQPPFDSLAHLLHHTPIYRPFKNIFEYNEWTGKSADPAFSGIVEIQDGPLQPDQLDNPHGGLWIRPCGWIDAATLCQQMQNLLVSQFGLQIVPHFLDASQIDLKQNQVRLGEITFTFDHLVFAEGYRSVENALFPGMDLRPLKGEILEIEIPGLEIDFVLSKKIYLIPLGNHRFVTGATYDRDYANPDPTEAGTQILQQQLEAAIRLPYKTLHRRAGIRPTTPNRRPILGTHPEYPRIHLFNGMGTKGMLQAPYFADQMAQYLEGKSDILNRDIVLERVFPKNP